MSDLTDTLQSEDASSLPERLQFAQWFQTFLDRDRSADYRDVLWDLLRALLTQYQADGKDDIEPKSHSTQDLWRYTPSMRPTESTRPRLAGSLQLCPRRAFAHAWGSHQCRTTCLVHQQPACRCRADRPCRAQSLGSGKPASLVPGCTLRLNTTRKVRLKSKRMLVATIDEFRSELLGVMTRRCDCPRGAKATLTVLMAVTAVVQPNP